MWRSPKIATWLVHCLNQSRINWGRKKPNASRNNKYQPRWLYFCFCYKNPLLWQAIFEKSRQNHVCTKKRIDDIFLLVKLTFFFLIFQVSKSLNTQNGQCTNLKHSVVRQPGKICISMKPVTQCAIGCLPETPQPLNKRIPFTCFNEDRLGEHYAIKVYDILFCFFVKLISRKNNNKHEKAYQYFYNF